MLIYRELPEFSDWICAIRDLGAKQRIVMRLLRAKMGNLGDVKPIGRGVSELRIDYGPGYRIYIKKRGNVLIVVLCGGDKSSQSNDTQRAMILAQLLED